MYTSKRGLFFGPSKVLESVKPLLLPEEEILGLFHTQQSILITNMRIFGFDNLGTDGVLCSFPLMKISTISFGSFKDPQASWHKVSSGLKFVDDYTQVLLADIAEKEQDIFQQIFDSIRGSAVVFSDVPFFTKPEPQENISDLEPIDANIAWSQIPKGIKKGILENTSVGTRPLFIIVAGDEALVALTDSCLIIKVGVITGAFFGGLRVTSFFYSDITSIEYNGGAFQGRVNILTASFSGNTVRDLDIGSIASTDPGERPNTIEMGRNQYKQAKKYFDALRELIAKSKSGASTMPSSSGQLSLADEIGKLADLLAKGLITNEEFIELKLKLLQK